MPRHIDLDRYPRNSLLVRASFQESALSPTGYVSVSPDDPGYEKLYQSRLERAEKWDEPMGYAAQEDGQPDDSSAIDKADLEK